MKIDTNVEILSYKLEEFSRETGSLAVAIIMYKGYVTCLMDNVLSSLNDFLIKDLKQDFIKQYLKVGDIEKARKIIIQHLTDATKNIIVEKIHELN